MAISGGRSLGFAGGSAIALALLLTAAVGSPLVREVAAQAELGTVEFGGGSADIVVDPPDVASAMGVPLTYGEWYQEDDGRLLTLNYADEVAGSYLNVSVPGTEGTYELTTDGGSGSVSLDYTVGEAFGYPGSHACSITVARDADGSIAGTFECVSSPTGGARGTFTADQPGTTPLVGLPTADPGGPTVIDGCLADRAYETLLWMLLGDPSSQTTPGQVDLTDPDRQAGIRELAAQLSNLSVGGAAAESIDALAQALEASDSAAAAAALERLAATGDPLTLFQACVDPSLLDPDPEAPDILGVDPCALLTGAEVEAVVGAGAQGPIRLEDGEACGYRVDDSHRLAWRVLRFSPDTAGDWATLPDATPLPDLGDEATWLALGSYLPDGVVLAVRSGAREILLELTLPADSLETTAQTAAIALTQMLLERSDAPARVNALEPGVDDPVWNIDYLTGEALLTTDDGVEHALVLRGGSWTTGPDGSALDLGFGPADDADPEEEDGLRLRLPTTTGDVVVTAGAETGMPSIEYQVGDAVGLWPAVACTVHLDRATDDAIEGTLDCSAGGSTMTGTFGVRP